MRRIGIVGAGQAGLQLALALQARAYEVILVTNVSADQIAAGRVTSSQCMFGRARQIERDLGLALWDDVCPPVDAISFTLSQPEGVAAIRWSHALDTPACSVDQRVKHAAWLRRFETVGGEVRLADADVATLEALARECDLVVVASGKGEIAQLFERDPRRSPYDQPQRALGLLYLDGVTPREGGSAVSFNLLPGVGETFMFPCLTLSGPCEVIVLEGVPGGPLDCWNPRGEPEAFLEALLRILERFAPWDHERCRDATVTDPMGVLAGRLTPVVRAPIAFLPSGSPVLGLADAVCLNDPIVGQGVNSAAKAAAIYADRIVEHAAAAFDAAWMADTFDAYWRYARHVVAWSNAMLQPPPPHVQAFLGQAQARPDLARWFANGFDDPPSTVPEFLDPEALNRRIAGP